MLHTAGRRAAGARAPTGTQMCQAAKLLRRLSIRPEPHRRQGPPPVRRHRLPGDALYNRIAKILRKARGGCGVDQGRHIGLAPRGPTLARSRPMTACPKCGAQMAMSDQFCAECGANAQVELEIQAFHQPALETARKWILAIGIIYVVSALIVTAISGDAMLEEDRNLLFGISIALCAIHVGLFVWAKKSPFPAAVVALVLFLTVQLINAAMDPGSIHKGIIIKILFLVALIRAVQAGAEANRMRGQR